MFFYVFVLILLAFPKPDYSKRPVLLIHCYFLDGKSTWSSLKGFLIKKGYPEEYIFIQEFKDVFGCNPEHGLEIKKTVEEIIKKTGKTEIDIVAHSMGALDGRYYIKYLCGYKYVKNFVSVAGANHGTKVACADIISCGAKDMCITSLDKWQENEFLKEINSCDETPYDGILYTSIWSEYDEIIRPPESSILDGALNIKTKIFPTGHGLILLNTKVHEYILEALGGAGQNNNIVNSQTPCYVVCESDEEKTDTYSGEAEVVEGDFLDAYESSDHDISETLLNHNDVVSNKPNGGDAFLFFKANRKIKGNFSLKGVALGSESGENSEYFPTRSARGCSIGIYDSEKSGSKLLLFYFLIVVLALNFLKTTKITKP